jgi:hypothetical protein
MKKIYYSVLVTLLFTVLIITACKTASSDPKGVAQAFMEALMKKDFDGAARYATKESQSALEIIKSAVKMAESFGNKEDIDIMKEARGKKITYSDAKMDGTERATVSVLADGKEQMPLTLKKEEGAWKVAFDKSTIMNNERSKVTDDTKPMLQQADSVIGNLGTMTDSISDALNEAKKALDSLKH